MAAREHFLKNLEMIAHSDLAPTIILVTHHVEEILPLFTQIMILKDGNIFKKGEIQQLLSSNLLSQLFNMEITIEVHDGRFFQTSFRA